MYCMIAVAGLLLLAAIEGFAKVIWIQWSKWHDKETTGRLKVQSV
jgi:hypothetical protein